MPTPSDLPPALVVIALFCGCYGPPEPRPLNSDGVRLTLEHLLDRLDDQRDDINALHRRLLALEATEEAAHE